MLTAVRLVHVVFSCLIKSHDYLRLTHSIQFPRNR